MWAAIPWLPQDTTTMRRVYCYINDEIPPVIHLFQASPDLETIFAKKAPPDKSEGWNSGRMHHMTWICKDPDAMKKRLSDNGIEFYEVSAGQNLIISVTDPDGIESYLIFRP
jgi:hypothetical protein